MLPYNASDMIRAMRRDHGLTLDDDAEGRNTPSRRGDGDATALVRFARWFGTVVTALTFL